MKIGFVFIGFFMALSSISHAETTRVCDSNGCRYVKISPACRGGIDQYTGRPC